MATKRLTVLQVLPALESGGVEKGTLEVAQALVQRGHRSLVMSAGGRLVTQLLAEGSEHFQWPIGKKSVKTLLLVSRFRKFLSQQQVDIVHIRSRMPGWIVYLAWRKMDKMARPKLVSTVHGFYSVNRYSAVMTKGEVVIAVSDSVKNYITDNYPEVDENRIRVIHRGIDKKEYPFGYKPPAEWQANWYREFPELKDKKIITLPGRITRLKGHEDFVSVISSLVKDEFFVMGVIAGGVDPRKQAYLDQLQQLVKEKGLEEFVVFTGQRSDLKEVLAISDIVLSLTQKPESFGRTTLEALTMGVPVCGYAHGGVKEQLDVLLPEGKVDVNDVQAICTVVKQWLKEAPVVAQEHDFLLVNMLNQTLDVYENIV